MGYKQTSLTKPGTFVYHKEYGFGIIIEYDMSKNFSDTAFWNNGKIDRRNDVSFVDLYQVDKDLVGYIKNQRYFSDLDYRTINKGIDYKEKNKIQTIQYDTRTRAIRATVSGSNGNIYSTWIDYSKKSGRYYNTADFVCSCPVKRNCKHCAAVVLKMNSCFSSLEKYAELHCTGNAGALPEEILNEISRLSSLRKIDYSDASDLIHLIHKSKSKDGLAEFCANIINCFTILQKDARSSDRISELITSLFIDEEIFKFTTEITSHLSEQRSVRAAIDAKITINESLEENRDCVDCCEIAQIRQYYKGQFEDCIRTYIEYNNQNQDDNDKIEFGQSAPIAILPDAFKLSKKLEAELFAFALKSTKGEVLRDIIPLLSDDRRKELFTNPDYKGPIPEEELIKLPAPAFLKFAKDRTVSKTVVLHLLEHIQECSEKDPEAVACIIDQIMNSYSTLNKEQILSQASILPDALYLNMYFENYLYDYYYVRSNFESTARPLDTVDEVQLLRYFKPQWNISFISDDSNVYSLSYYLASPIGKIALECCKDENGKLTKNKNLFDRSRKSCLFKYLVTYIDRKCGSDIKKCIADHEALVNQTLLQRKYDLFEEYTYKLSAKKSRQIGQSRKYGLDLYFTVSSDYEYFLSFKVGDTKKFVVTDVLDFLHKFRDAGITHFGKTLALVHSLSNFDDISVSVLNILFSVASFVFYEQKKSIIVSPRLCKQLLLLYKGRNAWINDERVFISSDEIKVDVKLGSDYRIMLNSNGRTLEISKILDLDDALLLIDKNAKGYFITSAEGETDFIKFAANYNGLSIKPVIESFRSNIMPYFRNNIILDEAIKDEFPISNLNIKAYFDYDDHQVKLSTKLFINEKDIASKDLVANQDIVHYDSYRKLIEGLGFVDDVLDDESMILNFFRTDFTELKNYCDVMLSESIIRKTIQNFSTPQVRVEHKGNIAEALMLQSEYSEEELSLIYKAIKKKKSYVLLSDERIIALDNENAQEFNKTIEDLALDPKHLYEEKKLSLAQSLRALSHKSSCQLDEYLGNMIKDINGFKGSNFDTPKINGSFRQYQTEAVNWLRILSGYGVGGILADDMGLGKTLEIIGLIVSDKTKQPSLILCPKSLIFNWKNEFAKFAPEEKIIEIYGSAGERAKIIKSIKKDKTIYISSYDSLRNDIGLYDKVLFNYIIADEAQNIKNTATQKSKNTKLIKANHKFALTGTPIENSVSDLWSIFDFILPGYFSDLNGFMNEYGDNDDAMERLAKQIGPFVLRRTKELVLQDLPDKFERIISAEMSVPQRQIYDAYINQARSALEGGSKAFDMLPYLTRLRQICVDPNMFVENYEGDSGKLSLLSSMIDEYIDAGHRILIFSQFVKALNSIEEMLNAKKLSYFVISGSTPADKRVEYTEKFNSGSEEKICLISLKAGGTGLNLTGADTVIHVDPWWNLSAENQATDRAHRIGQSRNVEVIKLICERSIEEKVVELQNIKKNTIDKVISNDDSSVTTASFEDIAFILS